MSISGDAQNTPSKHEKDTQVQGVEIGGDLGFKDGSETVQQQYFPDTAHQARQDTQETGPGREPKFMKRVFLATAIALLSALVLLLVFSRSKGPQPKGTVRGAELVPAVTADKAALSADTQGPKAVSKRPTSARKSVVEAADLAFTFLSFTALLLASGLLLRFLCISAANIHQAHAKPNIFAIRYDANGDKMTTYRDGTVELYFNGSGVRRIRDAQGFETVIDAHGQVFKYDLERKVIK